MEKNDLLAVVGPAADQIDFGTNFIEWSIAVIGPTAYQIDFTALLDKTTPHNTWYLYLTMNLSTNDSRAFIHIICCMVVTKILIGWFN